MSMAVRVLQSHNVQFAASAQRAAPEINLSPYLRFSVRIGTPTMTINDTRAAS